MSPLSGSRVIPPGWAEHHRPVADQTMTAPCRILRPDAGPPPFGSTAPAETVIWSGFCRVQTLATRRDGGVQADQVQAIAEALIVTPVEVLPLARGGEGGDIVETVGRRYQILRVTPGSLLWETDLICQDNQTQNQGAR